MNSLLNYKESQNMSIKLELELAQIERQLRRIDSKLRKAKGDYFFHASERVKRANDLTHEARRILINGRLVPRVYQ